MTTHPGACKFCQRTLQLEVDDDCPEFHIAAWLPIAACDRCADFRMVLLRLGDRCVSLLGKVSDARNGKNYQTVRSEADAKLEQVTREIMRSICDHYRVQNYWERGMVDEMFEKPDKVRYMINFMRGQVQRHRGRA